MEIMVDGLAALDPSVFVYDPMSSIWIPPSVHGMARGFSPAGRIGAQLISMKPYLFLLGGQRGLEVQTTVRQRSRVLALGPGMLVLSLVLLFVALLAALEFIPTGVLLVIFSQWPARLGWFGARSNVAGAGSC